MMMMMMMMMQTQLTGRLEEKGLWWKDSSLKIMGTEGTKGDMVTKGLEGDWVHKEVVEMEVLGVRLDVRDPRRRAWHTQRK